MDQQTPEKPGLLMRGLIWLMPKMTPAHVWMYRKLHGRFVNRATGGAPVLLMTTTGRRSSQPALPAWIHNLHANPKAEVELGGKRYPARAEFLEGEEWQEH